MKPGFHEAEQFEFPLAQGEFAFAESPAIYCPRSSSPVLWAFSVWAVLRVLTWSFDDQVCEFEDFSSRPLLDFFPYHAVEHIALNGPPSPPINPQSPLGKSRARLESLVMAHQLTLSEAEILYRHLCPNAYSFNLDSNQDVIGHIRFFSDYFKRKEAA